MNPVNLLYISQDGCAPSGITTYGLQILEHQPSARMLLLNAMETWSQAVASHVCRVHLLASDRSHDPQAIAAEICVILRSMEGAVILAPNTGDTPWSATVALLARLSPRDRDRVRVLGIVHSDVETQYAGAVRYAGIAPVWVGVSRRCADELRRRIPGHEVWELPYPMPLAPKASSPNRADPLRLIYAGRLEEPQKRISRLAAVLARLSDRNVPCTAVVAGDGPARATFESRLAASSGAKAVQCVGAVDRARLTQLLAQSDVFLLTSSYEGLPLAMLEAMAAGVCPVVMRIESGLDDVLIHGENAVIVDQGDVAAMANEIEQLAHDRDRLDALKRAARETIAKRFAPEIHFNKLRQIVDRCFAAPPPDPACIGPDPTAQTVLTLMTEARASGRPVVVYGAGMFGRKVVDAALDASLPIAGWVDSDPARSGMGYRGLVCATPEAVKRWPDAAFVVGSVEFAEEITDRIQALLADEPHPPHIVRVRR